MNQNEYIQELRVHLKNLSLQEKEEIIRDQQEYFRDALNSGRKEEEIIAALGSPKTLAENLCANMRVKQISLAKSIGEKVRFTVSAIFAFIALAPINVLAIFGPFLFLSLVSGLGWALAAIVLIVSLGLLAIYFAQLIFFPLGILFQLSTLFFLLGLLGSSVIGFFIMLAFTHLVLRGILAYLNWNLKIIRARN